MMQNQEEGTGDTGAWDNGGIFTKIRDGEQGLTVVVCTPRG